MHELSVGLCIRAEIGSVGAVHGHHRALSVWTAERMDIAPQRMEAALELVFGASGHLEELSIDKIQNLHGVDPFVGRLPLLHQRLDIDARVQLEEVLLHRIAVLQDPAGDHRLRLRLCEMQMSTEYVAEKVEQQSSAVQRLQIGESPVEIERGRGDHEALQNSKDADPEIGADDLLLLRIEPALSDHKVIAERVQLLFGFGQIDAVPKLQR